MKKLTLFPYIKPYRGLAILSPLLMMGEVACDMCLPFLMSFIIDYGITGMDVFGAETDSRAAVMLLNLFTGDAHTATPGQMLFIFGGLMIAITLVGGFFGTFCAWTAAKASQGFGHDLRCDAYKSVMSLSIEQTDKFTTGSLVTRMTNDISMIVEFVEALIRHFVRAPMFLILGTTMLLTLNKRFGLVLLCFLPVMGFTMFFVLKTAIPLFSKVQTKLDRVNAVVQENVSGVRVVKACTREEYECERFGTANAEMRDVNLRVLKLMAIISPIMNIVMNFSIIMIILIGGLDVRNGALGMTTGAVMAGISYVTQVLMSIMMLVGMFNSVSRAVASGKRVTEVLNAAPVLKNGDKTADATDTPIVFKNVSFRYPGTVGSPVLHDINLEIKRGETLAVIGATGCGKTSLVNLIPRFYDPDDGEVLVDGVNLKDYDMNALRQKIGFVQQKSELFSGTVAENIRWGKDDATDAEIAQAAETAQAAEFIEGFEGQYQGYVAEKGASLSGGQKQRMSIARALVRKPEILILDDATSALDLATEAKLQNALRDQFDDTTVVLIAQRIASVMKADRIAVLENGTIIACAPHDELMKTCETYRDIYDSQRSQMREGGAD